MNKSVPFDINSIRVLGLIFISIFIYSLKTKEYWREKYSSKNFKQNLTLMIIIDVGILSIFFINQGCSSFAKDMYSDNLVKALSRGEVFISDVPDNSKLEALNNPYDSIEREELRRSSDYIWDAAYYNQKYYVYFGALPAILIMVPYYLITKKIIATSVVTLIFSLLSVLVLGVLTKRIFEKYFKELPFKYMALSVLIMILEQCSSGLMLLQDFMS